MDDAGQRGPTGSAAGTAQHSPARQHVDEIAAALREAAAEVAAAGERLALAARWFDRGCVAVAVGGAGAGTGTGAGADPDAVATYLRGLERSARTELVVDLGGVRSADRRLGRVLARARIRFLIAGARVEWHHLPPGLEEELVAGALPPVDATHP